MKREFDRSESGLSAFINEAKGFEALKNLSLDKKVKHFKKEMSFLKKEIIHAFYTLFAQERLRPSKPMTRAKNIS